MTFRSLSTSLVTLALLGLASRAAADSLATPETLADTTVVDHWTLANGLRVTTRHVPGAAAVAITVGYAIGTDDDPPGREGLMTTLAEVAFLSAAGDIPARTRDDLDSQRPLGWSHPVSRRSILFTEIARTEQFPGVLNQVATRMRGVQVTHEGLTSAIHDARDDLSQQLIGSALGASYFQVREVGLGRKGEDILRRASGRELAKLTVAEADQQVKKLFVPANAALSIAGNLEDIDVRALVGNLFGSIPKGTAASPAPRPRLQPQSRVLRVPGLREPAGVVGIIAPALDDSLHPSFYLNAMLLGSHFNHLWLRDQEGQAPNRHHYAIFDEPDLMRVFPPVAGGDADADAIATRMSQALGTFAALVVTREPYEELRSNVLWLLGGPMSPEIAQRARTEPAVLHTLARAQAGRALWGGERFWADYRARFEAEPPGRLGWWLEYFKDPKHQIRLLMLPRR